MFTTRVFYHKLVGFPARVFSFSLMLQTFEVDFGFLRFYLFGCQSGWYFFFGRKKIYLALKEWKEESEKKSFFETIHEIERGFVMRLIHDLLIGGHPYLE